MLMKNLYLSLALLFFLNIGYSALPQGTTAPDWTLTDIDGETHHLYDYLDQGIHVILDFSATWCGPCWNYHNSGVMEALWEDYGPDGTGEIMIFMVEGDSDTNLACLYGSSGCNNTTYGDWTQVPYPILNLEGSDLSYTTAYNVTYWPTIYGINANDYATYEVGQPNATGWEEIFFQSFAMAAAPTADPGTCSLDGSVYSNVTGGAGSLNYLWSNGNSNTNLINVPSGVYGLTVTDNNGVFVTSEIELVNGNTDIEIMSEIIDNINCYGYGNGSITVDVASNSGLTYNWSNNESTAAISNLEPGIYELTITNTSNDCEIYDAFLIFEPDELEVELSSEDAICGDDNGIIDVYIYGGVEPYEISVNGNEIGGASAAGLQPGPYDVDIVDDNGCTVSTFITVLSQEAPEAVVSNASGIINCDQSTVLLESVGSTTGSNISYSWYNSSNSLIGDEATVEVSEAGEFTLEVIDDFTGCSTVVSIVVEADTDIPAIALASEGVLTCDVTSVTINSEGSESGANISYMWTDAAGVMLGEGTELEVGDAGAYTLSVSNSLTGCSSELTTSVEADTETPEVALGIETLLNCNTTLLTLEDGASEDASFSYSWAYTDADGNIVAAEGPLDVTEAATYIAVITHAGNGCMSMQDVNIEADLEAPEVILPEVNYILDCSDAAISLDVETSEGHVIAWTTEDGNIAAGNNLAMLSVDQAGTYTVLVTNPVNGCTTTESVMVSLEDNEPVAIFDFNIVGTDVTMQNNSEGMDNTYAWDFGNGETSTEENPTVTLTEGTYDLCLTVTNDCGTDTNCSSVSIGGPLQSSGTVGEILCFGDATGTINLSISGGAPTYVIDWSGPSGYSSDEEDITGLTAGTYTVTIIDADETVLTQEYTITEPTAITSADELIIDDEANLGSGSIDVNISGGTGSYTFLWSNGETTEDITGLTTGDYTLEVTDANDCLSTFTYTVNNLISSLNEITNISSLSVYPQPASKRLMINLALHEASEFQVELINVSGVLLQKHTINGKNITKELSLIDVESGYYILRILEEEKAYTQGVIVIK